MQGALAQAPRHSAPLSVNLRSGVVDQLVCANGHADDVMADFQVIFADGDFVIHGIKSRHSFDICRSQAEIVGLKVIGNGANSGASNRRFATCRAVNGSINTTPSQQRGIRRVDDDVHGQLGDVTLDGSKRGHSGSGVDAPCF